VFSFGILFLLSRAAVLPEDQAAMAAPEAGLAASATALPLRGQVSVAAPAATGSVE